MRCLFYIICFVSLAAVFTACKDPYIPPIRDLDREILVVEGYIDGAQRTDITLSRVKSLGKEDTSYVKYISDAYVVIEDDQHGVYQLFPVGSGRYTGAYALSPMAKYRLVIRTNDGKEYASDFLDYQVSPPIDSISYRRETAGARFMVSTHDNTGKTRFYRWKFEETWQYRSYYMTDLQYDRGSNQVVDLSDSIYNCWQFDHSSGILLSSIADQTQNALVSFPVHFIPNGSIKLSYLYSLLLRQYAMDSTGYDYYRQLKKNTEETGGIFDPQPGNLKGNIRNVHDPDEIVVGYVGAGSSTQRRAFFSIPWDFREDCSETILVPGNRDSIALYFGQLGYWPILEETDGSSKNWRGAFSSCVDCRIRGTNVKPSYWP